jgi:hypothetical protein
VLLNVVEGHIIRRVVDNDADGNGLGVIVVGDGDISRAVSLQDNGAILPIGLIYRDARRCGAVGVGSSGRYFMMGRKKLRRSGAFGFCLFLFLVADFQHKEEKNGKVGKDQACNNTDLNDGAPKSGVVSGKIPTVTSLFLLRIFYIRGNTAGT